MTYQLTTREKIVSLLHIYKEKDGNLPAIDSSTSTSSKAASDMADKVKEVAAGEAERLKALTTEAVRSQAYLYPIKVQSTYWVGREF